MSNLKYPQQDSHKVAFEQGKTRENDLSEAVRTATGTAKTKNLPDAELLNELLKLWPELSVDERIGLVRLVKAGGTIYTNPPEAILTIFGRQT